MTVIDEQTLDGLRAKSERFALDDIGNGQRFVRANQGELRYVPEVGEFFCWDGKRWCPNGGLKRDEDAAKRVARAMKSEAAKLEDDEASKQLFKHAHKSAAGPKLREMVRLASSDPDIQTSVYDFDRHPFLINTPSCVVDVRTLAELPHDRELLLTQLTRVPYIAGAHLEGPGAEILKRYMVRTFGDDVELHKGIFRIYGVAMLGVIREVVLIYNYGPGGSGKGTLSAALTQLGGDYVESVKTETLLASGPRGPRDGVVDLYRKRLAMAEEIDGDAKANGALLKQLTGGGELKGAAIYKREIKFSPTHTLVLESNHRLQLPPDTAYRRRLIAIPFVNGHDFDAQDPKLKEEMLSTEAQIALLSALVAGAHDYLQGGLNIPPAIKDETDRYFAEIDVVSRWLDECCVIDLSAFTQSWKLHNSYKEWAAETGAKDYPLDQFVKLIRNEKLRPGVEPGKVAHKRGVKGLRLR